MKMIHCYSNEAVVKTINIIKELMFVVWALSVYIL